MKHQQLIQEQIIDIDNNLKIQYEPSNALNKELNTQKNNQNIQISQGNYNLSNAAHPIACIFTFLFKIIAIIFYLFGGFIFNNVFIFVFCVILNSFDFWTVKNITGRLLVGLRWKSDYNEKGQQVWKCQSHNYQFKSNKVDSAFFWTSQICGTVFWIVFFALNIFRLYIFWVLNNNQSILCYINLTLQGTNLWGYYKCNSNHKQKIDSLKKKAAQKGFAYLIDNIGFFEK